MLTSIPSSALSLTVPTTNTKLASHFKVMLPSHYSHTLLSLCGMAFILLDWRWACSPLDRIDVKGMDCHIKGHWPSMLCCSCQCCCCVESGSAALQTGIELPKGCPVTGAGWTQGLKESVRTKGATSYLFRHDMRNLGSG